VAFALALQWLCEPGIDLQGSEWVKDQEGLPEIALHQMYHSAGWLHEVREEKSTLAMRPLFHHCYDTRIGHIVASFLALRLEVDLQKRLDEKKITTSWPGLMRDLKRVQAVHMEMDGKKYILRTDMPGTAHQALSAAGARPPSPVNRVEREKM
jgi:hypothetical protein